MKVLNFKSISQAVGVEADFDLERLKTPIATDETFAEFLALDKTEQLALKDKGGFLAAVSKDGTRKKEAIVLRTMLTLDLDDADVTTLETIKATAFCKFWVHSTRKHTADNPRFRLIVPLKEPVKSEDYEVLARFFAQEINVLEACDPAGFRTAQLMLWPTVSRDMLDYYVFFESPMDELLDVDVFLSKFDIENVAKWPRKRSEAKAIAREVADPNDDPRTKSGVVGAFCRTYSVEEAVEKFLKHVYEPSKIANNRFDLLAADSLGGLVIYDDVFAFSFHTKDEAAGQRLNAYDIVRIHLFGDLDNEASEGTPFARLPSNIKMSKFALSIKEVRENLFSNIPKDAILNDDLKLKLDFTVDGKIKNTLRNICLIFEGDEALKGISLNTFTNKLTVSDEVPWRKSKSDFDEKDFSELAHHFSSMYAIEVSDRNLMNGLNIVSAKRTFHPIKDWLNSLPKWDEIPRLETYLTDYLGAADNYYTRFVAKIILLSAIARVMEPGIKYEIVPVLVGPQGCGKSTIFSKLFGAWFSDSLTLNDMRDKAAIEKMEGILCFEIAELSGMAKADLELIKSFLSRQVDKCRFAYGRVVVTTPRQCVFVATTNQVEGFLRDTSGNRRFAPVEVTGECEKHPWDMTDDVIDQIWAEAFHCYKTGNFKLFFDGEIKVVAEAEQKAFLVHDDRRGLVEEFLAKPIPCDGSSAIIRNKDMPLNLRTAVCNLEIFADCFGKDPADFNRVKDASAIAQIMASIDGWSLSKEYRMTPYGKQRCYIRTEK